MNSTQPTSGVAVDYPLRWFISWSEAELLFQVPHADDLGNGKLLACILLPILPMISLTLSACHYIAKGERSHQLARIDGLYAAKTATAFCIAAIEIYKYRLQQTISPSALSVYTHSWMNSSIPLLYGFLPLLLVAIIPYEHIYATQSSAMVTVFLLASAIADAAQAVMPTPSIYAHSPAVFFTSLALKACLLLLQELPKSLIEEATHRDPLGIEERAGFLSRTFGLWIHSTLFLCFKRTIRVEDLAVFGPSLSSKALLHRFQKYWSRTNKASTWDLAFALFRVVRQPLVLASIYEVALAVCQYSLPALVQLTLEKLQPGKGIVISKQQLVFLTFMAHMAVCLNRSISRHTVNRVCTMLSSTLTAALLQKDTLLRTSEGRDAHSIAFLADVTGIVDIARILTQLLLSIFGPIVGTYIMWKTMRSAVLASLAFRMLWALISFLLQPFADAAAAVWNKAINARTSHMAKVLVNIKQLKMMGLNKEITDVAQRLQEEEATACNKSQQAPAAVHALMPLENYFATGALILGCFHANLFRNGLDPSLLFPLLLLDNLLFYPFQTMAIVWPQLRQLHIHLENIRQFLILPEHQDPRIIRDFTNGTPITAEEFGSLTPEEIIATNRCISLHGVSIAATKDGDNILQGLQLSIISGTLTVINGPTGSGKSLLLKALLGEVDFIKGWLHVSTKKMAYCSQTIWLPNVTIKEAVVGDEPFDAEWYMQVVKACCLEGEDNRLNIGEHDTVGTNGAKLSGGQKQRLALARAVYSKAPILLADDVLSSLDSTTARFVYKHVFGKKGLLKKHGRTAILTTSSPEWLKSANQVITLDMIGSYFVYSKKSAVKTIVENAMLKMLKAPLLEQVPSQSLPIQQGQHEWDLDIQAEEDSIENPSLGTSWSHYKFLFQSVTAWQLFCYFVAAAAYAFVESNPNLFNAIWLVYNPTNNSRVHWYWPMGIVAIAANITIVWYSHFYFIPKVALSMHSAFLEAVMNAKLSFVTSASNGSLLARFNRDVTLMSFEIPWSIFHCAYTLAFLLSAIPMLLLADLHLAALALTYTTIAYVLQSYYLSSSRQIRLLDLKSKAPLYVSANQTSSGIEHIRGLDQHELTLNKTLKLLDQTQTTSYYSSCTAEWLSTTIELCSVAHFTVLIWAVMTWPEQMSANKVGIALFALFQFEGFFVRLIQRWVKVQTWLGIVKRLQRFVEKVPTETDDDVDADIAVPENWPSAGDVEFRNVSATYDSSQSSKMVLENISFSIEDGHTTLITGKTGCGKSSLMLTLLKCIPYVGSIIIDGVDIANVPRERLRQSITTIPQDGFQVPDGTVRDNLFPCEQTRALQRGITSQAIRDVLTQVGLMKHIDKHGGYNIKVTAMCFSAGQLQLLNVARAIFHHRASNSNLILMDEITSSLDVGKDEAINNIVQHEFSKCTILLISHRKTLDLRGYHARLTLRRGFLLRHRLMADVVPAERTSHDDVQILIAKNKFIVRSAPASTFGPPRPPSDRQQGMRCTASVRSLDASLTRINDQRIQRLVHMLAFFVPRITMIFAHRFLREFSEELLLSMLHDLPPGTPSIESWDASQPLTARAEQNLQMLQEGYARYHNRVALDAASNEFVTQLNDSASRIIEEEEEEEDPNQTRLMLEDKRCVSPVSGATAIVQPPQATLDVTRLINDLEYETARRDANSVYHNHQLPDHVYGNESETPPSSLFFDATMPLPGETVGFYRRDSMIFREAGEIPLDDGDHSEPYNDGLSDSEPVDVDGGLNHILFDDLFNDSSDEDEDDDDDGNESPDDAATLLNAGDGSSDGTATLVDGQERSRRHWCPPPERLPRIPDDQPRGPNYVPGEYYDPFTPSADNASSSSQPVPHTRRRFEPRPSPLSCVQSAGSSSGSSSSAASSRSNRPNAPSWLAEQPRYAARPEGQPNSRWLPAANANQPTALRNAPPHYVPPPPTSTSRGLFADREAARDRAERAPTWPPTRIPDRGTEVRHVRMEADEINDLNRLLGQTLRYRRAHHLSAQGLLPVYTPFAAAEGSLEATVTAHYAKLGLPLPRAWALARSPLFWTMEVPGLDEPMRAPSVDHEDGDLSDRAILSAREHILNDMRLNRSGNWAINQHILRQIESGVDLPTGPGYEMVLRVLCRQAPTYMPVRRVTRPATPDGR